MFEKLRKPGKSHISPGKKFMMVLIFGTICLVFVFLGIGPGRFGDC